MASTAAPTDRAAELADRVRAARLPTPSARRRIREAAGLSLRTVADALEVDVMTVHRWEHGAVTPRLEHAIRYRSLLDALEQAVEQ